MTKIDSLNHRVIVSFGGAADSHSEDFLIGNGSQFTFHYLPHKIRQRHMAKAIVKWIEEIRKFAEEWLGLNHRTIGL